MGRTKVIITEDQSSKDKFEKLYLSYFSKMKHFAKEYVIADEDAENLVQDVFTELWERKELLDMPVNLLAYLFTSIKNKSLNYLRHKSVEQQTMTLMQEEYNLTLNMNLNALEEFDDKIFAEDSIEKIINHALDSLSERCRQIFIMNKLQGKKQKQIAEELNISINTVETQMKVAYKKLREELKDYTPLFLFLYFL